jgi:subtilase family serine protease
MTAGAGILAAPALAAPAVAAGSSQTVTLVLSAPNRPGLQALASTTGLTRAERVAKLAALVPGAKAHLAVAAGLRQRGLTVRSSSTWTVTATGSATAVEAAFGRGSRTSSVLPAKPTTLAPYVSSVLGGSAGPGPARQPLGIHAGGTWGTTTTGTTTNPVKAAAVTPTPPYYGAGLRNLYAQSTDGSPGGGAVATLQFDGWDYGALNAYANARGLPTPQYTQISVNGAAPNRPQTEIGALEVALDQETLLGVSPHTAQRAYFTTNDDTGSIMALARIASDATNVGQNYYGLVAMSTSWGLCETSDTVRTSEEPILESIVAAGVTVFASTGDGGAYDCQSGWGDPSPRLAVDYPASSPVVVGVGGTTKYATSESGWIDGGGGASSAYPRPAYQSQVAPSAGNHRLVPDISAVADPSTGYSVYYPTSSAPHGWQTVGGTSLAAPAMTAMLANALGTRGALRGIGDIHCALYHAPSSAIRDITTGGNDYYNAVAGYDMSTGLGSPKWDALATVLATPQRACVGDWGGTVPRPTRPPHWGTPGK